MPWWGGDAEPLEGVLVALRVEDLAAPFALGVPAGAQPLRGDDLDQKGDLGGRVPARGRDPLGRDRVDDGGPGDGQRQPGGRRSRTGHALSFRRGGRPSEGRSILTTRRGEVPTPDG